jgi:O-antigen/teichoic acid export membrane protein
VPKRALVPQEVRRWPSLAVVAAWTIVVVFLLRGRRGGTHESPRVSPAPDRSRVPPQLPPAHPLESPKVDPAPALVPVADPPSGRCQQGPTGELGRAGLFRRLSSHGLVRAGVVTYALSTLTLLAYLIAGIVTARGLGPHGRGITVALSTITILSGFLFAMGAAQGVSYFLARRPEDGPTLLTTWLLMLVPCAIVGIVVTEALLTSLFSAHAPSAISTGRWYVFTIVLVIGLELNSGLLLGVGDYGFFNALRFAQPALVAVGITVLWRLDDLTVTSSLVVPTVATTLVLIVGITRAGSRIGIGRPDFRLGMTTLWYSIRGHGVMVASNVNARLDVALLPAFVSAASVGIYSVATNVSLIIYYLANTFAAVLIPAAARDAERANRTILGSLYATLVVAAGLALLLAVFAKPVLGAVYGPDFRQSALTLRLLLPGAVLFAASSVLTSGVYALGRPFIASSAQLSGMAVTVVGLLVFLRVGGIRAAALVSTAAYTTVFGATAIAYKRAAQISWRSFLPTRARIIAFVR